MTCTVSEPPGTVNSNIPVIVRSGALGIFKQRRVVCRGGSLFLRIHLKCKFFIVTVGITAAACAQDAHIFKLFKNIDLACLLSFHELNK